MKNLVIYKRFAVAKNILLGYIVTSFLVRLVLYFISLKNLAISLPSFATVFLKGFLFDLATGLAFLVVYMTYLVVFPSKYFGKKIDKISHYFILSLTFFIILFAFIGEFPFWDEFNTRYNFIAVDYLIYTYEVVENINQSYPIPVIMLTLVALIFLIFYILNKKGILNQTFQNNTKFKNRALVFITYILVTSSLFYFLQNKQAEWSSNTYENELAKNGVFSFFAAFRSNELDYDLFYPKIDTKNAYQILKKDLLCPNENYISSQYDNITRNIEGTSENKPNIILICIESLSAEYLKEFGSTEGLTPNIDQLANESIFFKNLYATGTRTVRGMEALTLCVPPTPGNSIVRRQNNDNLFSIATVLKEKDYQLNFIYGGDGYFDNMNTFFGGQGFTIIDRDRGNPLSDAIETTRISIPDEAVTFENAWGICDEDIYKQALKRANLESASKKPFFQFIMTTSNHKPYSFPENKIELPVGSREAAVKYTDFALGQFIKQAKKESWFFNTVFVIVADHCASSAGKWEINIEKHHIPAIIYNLNQKPKKIEKLASQIDLVPTLFGYLNWSYHSSFYGKDITKIKNTDERAFLGNYRTIGMLKGTTFTEINDRRKVNQYQWDANMKKMEKQTKTNDSLEKLTISYYQTASERFKNDKMKVTGNNNQMEYK